MIPLSDGIPARRFPFVNIAIIAANLIVWIFVELPHLGSSVYHASFYPCAVANCCGSSTSSSKATPARSGLASARVSA